MHEFECSKGATSKAWVTSQQPTLHIIGGQRQEFNVETNQLGIQSIAFCGCVRFTCRYCAFIRFHICTHMLVTINNSSAASFKNWVLEYSLAVHNELLHSCITCYLFELQDRDKDFRTTGDQSVSESLFSCLRSGQHVGSKPHGLKMCHSSFSEGETSHWSGEQEK